MNIKMVGYYIRSIKKETINNNYFRKVLFTGKHEQLVVMCLQPKEEIGNEVHLKTDQFFRIEQGEAEFILNNGKDKHIAKDGYAILIPARTYHNVINISKTKKLKFYTVYSPPNHKPKTIHRTKKDAEKQKNPF